MGRQPIGTDALVEVPVRVSVRTRRATLSLGELAKLGLGSLLSLDREAHEPADVLVNGKVIARGEIVTIDKTYGVRVTPVVKKGCGRRRAEDVSDGRMHVGGQTLLPRRIERCPPIHERYRGQSPPWDSSTSIALVDRAKVAEASGSRTNRVPLCSHEKNRTRDQLL